MNVENETINENGVTHLYKKLIYRVITLLYYFILYSL